MTHPSHLAQAIESYVGQTVEFEGPGNTLSTGKLIGTTTKHGYKYGKIVWEHDRVGEIRDLVFHAQIIGPIPCANGCPDTAITVDELCGDCDRSRRDFASHEAQGAYYDLARCDECGERVYPFQDFWTEGSAILHFECADVKEVTLQSS